LPDSGEFGFEGGTELGAVFKQLPAQLAEGAVRGGLKAGAKVFLKEAQSLAPLGHYPLPRRRGVREAIGTLREGMRVVSHKAGEELIAGITFIKAAFYWRFVEYGTNASEAHTTKKSGRHYRAHHATRKKPFLRPAFDTMQGQAVDAVVDYARRRVSQIQVKDARIAFGGEEEG